MSNSHRQSGERGERDSYSYMALKEGSRNVPPRMDKRARQRAPVEGHGRQAEIAEQHQEMGNDPRSYRHGPFHMGAYEAPGPYVQERQYSEEPQIPVDIRDLTHRQLLENPVYSDLFDAHADLEKKFNDLSKAHAKHRLKDVRVEVDTPAPVSRASAPLTPTPISAGEIPSVPYGSSYPPLAHEDYPGIKFWSRAAHNAHRAAQNDADRKTKKELKENVASDYLEYPNGTTVDNETVCHMRKFIRSLLNERKDELPTKFSKFGHAQKQYFFHNLYAKYPFLRLCESDWKADLLVARTMNSFANSNKRRAKEEGKVKGKGKGKAAESEEEESSADEWEDVDAEKPPARPIIARESNNNKRKAPKQKGGQSKRSRQDVVPAAESSRRATRSSSTLKAPQANGGAQQYRILSCEDNDVKPDISSFATDEQPFSLPRPASRQTESTAPSMNSPLSAIAPAPRRMPGPNPRAVLQEPEAGPSVAPTSASSSRISLSSTSGDSRSQTPVDQEDSTSRFSKTIQRHLEKFKLKTHFDLKNLPMGFEG